MANHKSAEKRNRQNIKRRERNRSARSEVRTAVKKTLTAAQAGDQAQARELLREAERTLAKAATKGILHKRNAARKISRLAAAVKKGATPTGSKKASRATA